MVAWVGVGRRAAVMVGLVAICGVRGHAGQGYTFFQRVTSSDRTTAMSGSGTIDSGTGGLNDHLTEGLSALSFYEQADDATEVTGWGRQLTDSTNPRPDDTIEKTVDIRGSSGNYQSKQTLELSRGYIVAIQVCTNGDSQPKIKGARIWGATLDANGKPVATSESPKFERPHCKRWASKVSCGADKVAVGFRMHWSDLYGTGYSGMSLWCSKVEPN